MKAVCSAKELAAALKVAIPAAGSTINGAWLLVADGVLDVTCTNLDQTITAQVPLASWENGEAIVPAKVATALVGSMVDDVAIELADDRLIVTSGDATARLWVLPTDEWPLVDELDAEPVRIAASAVADLKRLSRSMGLDAMRPKFYGAYLEGRHAWASDSYRCAAVDLGDVDLPAAHLPAPLLTAVLGAVDGAVEVVVGEHRADLASGATTWSTRLVKSDAIPDVWAYLHGFGDPTHVVTFDAGALRASVRRLISIGVEDMPVLDITIDGGRASLRLAKKDVGDVEDHLDVESNAEVAFAVRPSFLLDLIDADGRDEIPISFWPTFATPLVVDNGTLAQGLMRIRRPEEK